MRTPLPSLTDLPKGVPVTRCRACGHLAMGNDLCSDAEEAAVCMSEDPTAAQLEGRKG